MIDYDALEARVLKKVLSVFPDDSENLSDELRKQVLKISVYASIQVISEYKKMLAEENNQS